MYSNTSNCILCAASTRPSHLPMLRVTVMMFRDIVESVMLLNDEDWRGEQRELGGKKENMRRRIKSHKLEDNFNKEVHDNGLICSPVRPSVCTLTLSILEALGFRRRRRCRLIRREELCSVELLNLNTRKEENFFRNYTFIWKGCNI